jgi:hypothetical protein
VRGAPPKIFTLTPLPVYLPELETLQYTYTPQYKTELNKLKAIFGNETERGNYIEYGRII